MIVADKRKHACTAPESAGAGNPMMGRHFAMAAAVATALTGCEPVDDCTPGQFEVFRSPKQWMVFFQSGSHALSEKARETIRFAIESAVQPPAKTIDLVGHTDGAGPPDANHHLSQRRAEVVRNALVAGGVAPSRISSVARGATWPLVQSPLPTEQQNRRVEITVQVPVSEQAVGYLICRDGFRRMPSTIDRR